MEPLSLFFTEFFLLNYFYSSDTRKSIFLQNISHSFILKIFIAFASQLISINNLPTSPLITFLAITTKIVFIISVIKYGSLDMPEMFDGFVSVLLLLSTTQTTCLCAVATTSDVTMYWTPQIVLGDTNCRSTAPNRVRWLEFGRVFHFYQETYALE